ncbi:MAG TPA: hypothetical protein PLL30_00380 [Candidatus Krumholzibacteria bacterium]|nr:hypothetical protein [Candidatus Krumholzibacteria bacterium]HPD70215.1 hypothetical protein [Candidatus Krumholzibacteria bacterium]HRY40085.1 hypothetical protein [Candidatus Krumholzibacteria bacterium]
MSNRVNACFAVAILACLIPAAGVALMPYGQDFEGLAQGDAGALAADGWLVYGNVFGPDWSYWYGYGSFPAPNGSGAFCQIVAGEGGAEQGAQQLVVYSDYNNANHADGAHIESNVFQELLIQPGDVTETWVFSFQAKRGNIEGDTTALAFIKTLDPNNGWATTNFITVDLTGVPTTWGDYSLSILIDASLDGQILQFGFSNTATLYQGSSVFYDNINFYITGPVATEETTWTEVKSLFR